MGEASSMPDSAPLKMSRTAYGDVAVLSVDGEIDMATAPAFEAAIDEVLGNNPPTLIIDLSGVQFLDSAGLTVLMRTQHRRAEAGHFAVVAGRVCRKPIELIGLDKLFAVCPTLDEALATVGATAR